MIMVGALERGLKLSDFELLTVGMISDYITTYNAIMDRCGHAGSEQEDATRWAKQADFDRF